MKVSPGDRVAITGVPGIFVVLSRSSKSIEAKLGGRRRWFVISLTSPLAYPPLDKSHQPEGDMTVLPAITTEAIQQEIFQISRRRAQLKRLAQAQLRKK